MSNIHLENWHKYAPCLRHFVTMWDYMQRNKFRCYRTLRAYGSFDSVKDNSSGIPLEIKDKIFQPFFTTKPTGSGTGLGLGLSLSYDIIKAHGGELKVKSKEARLDDPRLNVSIGQAVGRGNGSEFFIHLPINADNKEKT